MPELMGGHLVEAEHVARYAWAAQFVEGRRVLDAACGEGYGAQMLLAAGAAEVVGVDIAEEVIAELRERELGAATFDVGDVCGLPYDDDEFDIVVSFETIEHVSDPGLALDEFARVLRPNGILVVSTPNRDVYTPGNPFHLRELTPNELESQLLARFPSVAMCRQHTWIASGVLDDEAFALDGHDEIERVDLRKGCSNEPGRETYTIALAGDGDLPVGRNLFSLTADMEIRDWSRRLEEAGPEKEMIERELRELRHQLARCEADLAEFTEIDAKLAHAQVALREHELILASASWRITRPLRSLSAWLRRLRS